MAIGIGHGYGNRRARIDLALASGVPMIELDLRWWGGQVWVRHERRMRFLPVLYNHRLRGIHRDGPYAFPVGRLWLRLDLKKIRFRDVLERVAGQAGLLIDLKADSYSRSEARGFVATVLTELEDARFPDPVDFCGGWNMLDIVRTLTPGQRVHYSVDSTSEWTRIQTRLAAGGGWDGGISLQYRLITPERVSALEAAGLDFLAWDVETREEMDRATEAGASGIIADDLGMLAALREPPPGPEKAQREAIALG